MKEGKPAKESKNLTLPKYFWGYYKGIGKRREPSFGRYENEGEGPNALLHIS